MEIIREVDKKINIRNMVEIMLVILGNYARKHQNRHKSLTNPSQIPTIFPHK